MDYVLLQLFSIARLYPIRKERKDPVTIITVLKSMAGDSVSWQVLKRR